VLLSRPSKSLAYPFLVRGLLPFLSFLSSLEELGKMSQR
jgi:hypothetical protein